MKHLSMRFVGSVAGALALVASLAVAAVGTAGNETAAAPAPVKPPNVPNAKALKAKFGGTSLTFLGDGPVGKSHTRDQLLVAKFSKDTGIKVKLVPHPADSSASYSQLARTFSAKSSAFDVVMLDVVWPGAFAQYLVDLKPALAREARAALRRDHQEQHDQREARRDALVRRLRHPLLPHRPAEEVRLLLAAEDLGPAGHHGEEDPGRRAGQQPELLRVRLPGQRVRGPDLRRARVVRIERRRATSSTTARRRSTTRGPSRS